MINYQYPVATQLRRINAEKIVDLQRPRPTFRLFPTIDRQQWRLEWTQRDNYRGFQQLRGLNGRPSYVKMQGEKAFSQQPGVFGEYMEVDEEQMTMRAMDAGNLQTVVDINDLIIERQEYLNLRETDLLEWEHWAILLNGTFTILGPLGAIFMATFPVQVATFSDWSVHNTATPVADLMGLKVLQRGKSVNFGALAEAFMNSTMTAHMMQNTNPADIGGMRLSDGVYRIGTPISLADINIILRSRALPAIFEYDEGYNRESDGAFTMWLPDDVISIVGARTNGDNVGEHHMVRNINNPNNAAGRYTKVIDTLLREVPRKISVHQGHNGGLVLFYASALIRAAA